MLSFASAPGNIANRLGKLGLLASQVRLYQSSQLINMTDTVNGVVAQYNSESDIQALLGSAYIGALAAPETICQTAQTIAQATVNRMVFRDNPRLSQTLTQLNVIDSLREIIRQMGVAGATFLAMTVGATPSPFTGVGNGVLNLSTKRPFDGRTLENAYAENLLFTCNNDSYTGGTVAGNEQFQLTGTGQQTDFFAFNWPLGSNANTNISAIDGDANNGSGNLLTNSNFKTATITNIPDSWTAIIGTAGTDFALNGGITYGNSPNSLQFIGTGVNVDIRQTPTSGTFNPLTQYGVCIFMRGGGSAPNAGILKVQLIDGNGNVINDASGNPINILPIDCTQLTTNFVGYVGQFRTPEILPPVISVQLLESTAIQTGVSVYAAKLSVGLMNQAYASGPYGSIHAGSLPFSISDFATGAITNSRGTGGTLNTFQTLMARLFPNEVYGQQLLFPSALSPNNSIPDSLIG